MLFILITHIIVLRLDIHVNDASVHKPFVKMNRGELRFVGLTSTCSELVVHDTCTCVLNGNNTSKCVAFTNDENCKSIPPLFILLSLSAILSFALAAKCQAS